MNICRKLCIGFVAIICAVQLTSAQDVVLVPAHISGTVSVTGFTLTSSSRVYGNGGGNSSNVNIGSGGSYTLTVNAPANGSQAYNVYATVYTNGNNYLQFANQSVTVGAGDTVTKNFQLNPAIIEAAVNVTGATLSYAYLYTSGGSGSTATNARGYMNNAGSVSFPAQPNANTRIYGTAYMTNGQRATLSSKTINTTAGSTTSVSWDVEVVQDTPATISGAYGLNGVDSISRSYIYASGPVYKQGSVADGEYIIEGLLPGNYSVVGYLYMNNYADYLQLPRPQTSIPVEAGDNVIYDQVFDAAFVSGTVYLSGSREWESVNSAQVRARGNFGSAAQYAYAQSRPDLNNGRYTQILTAGDWNSSYSDFYFNFYDNSAESFINSSMTLYNYEAAPFSLSAGEELSFVDYNFAIGTATLNFSIAGGGQLSSPRVSATCQTYENGQRIMTSYLNAYGPLAAAEVGTVTLAGVPGDCVLTAYAKVGGSQVTFGRVDLELLAGTDIVVDIGGPSLDVVTPTPEQYVSVASIVLSGTTTDDSGIAELVVNGNNEPFASTNNSADPNEVGFNVDLGLQPGPNVITTIAVDTTGKTATDTRTVYFDLQAPTLDWTPANGATVSDSSVLVRGTATDDNEITKVTVDGVSVSVSSTNNPDDTNEVTFTAYVVVDLGENQIQVAATDNSKRTTTQTHTVTLADNSAPTANAGPDQQLECTDELTSVVLNGEASSDPDGDVLSFLWSGHGVALSGESVSVELSTGDYGFSLTVSDGNGASDSGNVSISVIDTVAPSIDAPTDQILEATTTAGASFAANASATDLCGTSELVLLPATEQYALGTTTISVTAEDESGNASEASFTVTVEDTTAPELTAPADVETEATAVQTPVATGEASASDIFPLSVSSDAPAVFNLGETLVNWSATDANGNSSTATQIVSIVDTTAPQLTVPASVEVEAEGVQTTVAVGDASATDIFPVTIDSDAPADFGLGTTLVNWTATDTSGNSSTGSQSVTVVDTTAPEYTVTQLTNELWPPNHKMVLVATVSAISDAVDADPQVDVTVSSNQAINGQGDGNTDPDWLVNAVDGGWEIWLRAERSGKEGARTYSYSITVADDQGNSTEQSGSAIVPHDQKSDAGSKKKSKDKKGKK